MKPNEYQKLAARTMNSTTIVDDNHAYCNWAMGLVGEVGEFVVAVVTKKPIEVIHKEFGDIAWYAAAFCTQMSKDFNDVVNGELIDPSDERFSRASIINPLVGGPHFYAIECLDHWKKLFCHGHALDVDEEMKNLQMLIGSCVHFAKERGVNIVENLPSIFEANIAKLRARYPEGFSTDASENREA